MPIRIRETPDGSQTKIQLVLPDDIHDGPISVVGNFNDWTPGRHRLVRRSNGTRSVTLTVVPGQELVFRYLGSGGWWFDEPEAHAIDHHGSIVRV